MEWLNYHHLLYFWMVAKHGSITRASAFALSVERKIKNPAVTAICEVARKSVFA